jgi:hypothetical protein
MGLRVILHIQQVDDDTVFDIPAANAHLMQVPSWGGFGELYGDLTTDPNWVGIFRDDQGKLQIANREEDYLEGYGDYSEVWGCFHDEIAKEIAQFVKAGKIVFHLEIEGNESEYFVCTPEGMKKLKQSDLRF